jgi:three-Cys-motif partner protein
MWLLFPLGISLNRLLARSGQIPDGWRRRITAFLGTDDWFASFYRKQARGERDGAPAASPTLFGDDTVLARARVEVIGDYFLQRLGSVFAGMAPPGVLRNTQDHPLYLLCFAAANPSGAKTALKIANHILKELR